MVGPGQPVESVVKGPSPVLSVRDLHVAYEQGSRSTEVVHGVSFDLFAGETLGLVGESGSGKSTTVLGLLGLLGGSGRVTAGTAHFKGLDLIHASGDDLRRVRGSDIGVVYQDALRALNPVMRINRQVAEVFEAHGNGRNAAAAATQALSAVGIPRPEIRGKMYPHQFSGGMRQRAVVAIALAMEPSLLIADEPTTALDVTIQAQILDLIKRMSADMGTATVLVSHDFGVIAQMSTRVLVMYAGNVVEQGAVDDVFHRPRHPYTQSLLASLPSRRAQGRRFTYIPGQPPTAEALGEGCPFAPRCYAAKPECLIQPTELLAVEGEHLTACTVVQHSETRVAPDMPDRAPEVRFSTSGSQVDAIPGVKALIELRGVSRWYSSARSRLRRGRPVQAVQCVDLSVIRGEVLGLVGESGSGKSTIGRLIVGLDRPTAGRVLLDGRDIARLGGQELRKVRRRAQLVFQDPRSSLNRRMTIADMLADAIGRSASRKEQRRRSLELLEMVGLRSGHLARYPHEFSGGESQRLAIARALATQPDLIVADEAVSSLDVSIRGQILNLLRDLREQMGLTYVFISHDLRTVRNFCDRVAVMYLGRVVELGTAGAVLGEPRHPYTVALRSAVPDPVPGHADGHRIILLPGETPDASQPPPGCRFHPRCPIGPTRLASRSVCTLTEPELVLETEASHACACHFPGELRDL